MITARQCFAHGITDHTCNSGAAAAETEQTALDASEVAAAVVNALKVELKGAVADLAKTSDDNKQEVLAAVAASDAKDGEGWRWRGGVAGGSRRDRRCRGQG